MLGKKFTRKKYHCTVCNGSYSRRYVLERHIKTIHNFENVSIPKPSRFPSPIPTERGADLTDLLLMQQLREESQEDRRFEHQKRMFEVAASIARTNEFPKLINQNALLTQTLKYLSQNCCMLRWSDISGISGHICKRCITFEFVPIKDLGHDKAAWQRHVCKDERINEVEKFPDKKLVLKQLRLMSSYQMIGLTNSWIPGKKKLVSLELSPFYQTKNYPFIRQLTVIPTWLENLINKGATELNVQDLLRLVPAIMGTYAVFSEFHLRPEIKTNQRLIYITNGDQPSSVDSLLQSHTSWNHQTRYPDKKTQFE